MFPTIPIKAVIIAVIVLALGAGGYFAYNHAYDEGVTSGKAEVQTKWDQDKLATASVAAAALAQAVKDKDDALKTNEGLINDYNQKLETERAATADTADRLQHALTIIAAGSSGVSKDSSNPGTTAASGHSSDDRFGQLSQLAAAAKAECKANDDRLNAVVQEIVRQPATVTLNQ